MESYIQYQQKIRQKTSTEDDTPFKQKETTAETEATKQAINEKPAVNQAKVKEYVTEVVRANDRAIEKCLPQRINRLNSDGKTQSCRSEASKYKRDKSKEISSSKGKDKSSTTKTNTEKKQDNQKQHQR